MQRQWVWIFTRGSSDGKVWARHDGHVLKDLYVTFSNITKRYDPALVTLYRITLHAG